MRASVMILASLVVAVLLAAPVATPVAGYESPGIQAAVDGGLRFDSTVTLGNVLTAAVFIVSLVAAYAGFKARLAVIELKLDTLWRAWIREYRREES